MSSRIVPVALVFVGLTFAGRTWAAAIAFDSAGDSAYNNIGQFIPSGVGGGYGWGSPWFGGMSIFIGSSSTNGNADPNGTGDINSPRTPDGRAWGIHPAIVLYRGIIELQYAERQFNGTLDPGQSFAIDFDNGSVKPGDYAAVEFSNLPLSAPLSPRAVYYIFTEGADYQITGTAISSTIDTGLATTYDGVHITLSPLDATDARISLTSIDSGQTVSLTVPYSPVNEVAIANQDQQFGEFQHNVFFNNISITPEPNLVFLCAILAFIAIQQTGRRRMMRR